ncbi:ATP-binding protein [Marinisporobacter balticus]|uniref:histidine kinase n=1 Tax=Marinisporobacter balticus TaxID=2018667 RepID=A0A4R2LBB6_9FIRM|nr:ATP-binding protein [Marinisporobacter balticus]TCO80078.1 two-component system sensor histidine kinase YcbA [Marinisporobacter balticus]
MRSIKKYIILILSVTLFGEIYFYPFHNLLRFSAGIIVLNLAILIDEDLSPFSISFFSGIAVFFVRCLIYILFTSMPFGEILSLHFPSIIYYILYGFFAFTTNIRKYKNQFIMPIIILAFTDIISNIFEIIIRSQTFTLRIIQITVLVGLARSIIAYFIYLLYKKQELFLLTREHQKRYSQLNILISDIQAEMFYLKKSTHDIESVMRKSYQLYETHKQDKILKQKTLDIAREIHEIKKDYYRVLNGFESFLKTFEKNGTMMLSDMLVIIRENTNRNLKENNNDLSVSFDFKNDFQLQKYYHLFTVLNNLIINAIDACKSKGLIKIIQEDDLNNIIFYVKDTGEGIPEDMLAYIFNPGFTTKYNATSGEPSTGIGLSHVKNIVDEFHGNIEVTSRLNEGTTFKIIIPKNSLIGW